MAKKEKKQAEEETLNVGADDSVNPQETTEEKQEATELEKLNDRFLRTMAEYDNYRKRTAKERMELETDITAKVITEFLPTLDNLERALFTECKDTEYAKGIKMIYDGMLEVLKKLGVEQIGVGEFDPTLHQAVQHVEVEGIESGQIANVFQKGYKIGNKVIRFAMVTVAK